MAGGRISGSCCSVPARNSAPRCVCGPFSYDTKRGARGRTVVRDTRARLMGIRRFLRRRSGGGPHPNGDRSLRTVMRFALGVWFSATGTSTMRAQVVIVYDSAAHSVGQKASLSYTSTRNRIVSGPDGARIMNPPNEVGIVGDGIDLGVRDRLVILETHGRDTRVRVGARPVLLPSLGRALGATDVLVDSVVADGDGVRLRILRRAAVSLAGDTLRIRLLPATP